jgi:tight adherence protein C
MVYLLLLFALALVGITVRLLIHAAVLPRLLISTHLRQIEGYGFQEATAEADAGSQRQLDRALKALAGRAGSYAMQRLPSVKPLRRGELTAAGYYDASVEAVHGYRLLAATFIPGLMLLFVVSTGGPGFMTLMLVGLLAAGGWWLPAIVIRNKGAKRKAEIDKELPELIDLLTATVEAGMGFAGSVNLVAGRFRGPLGDELRLTLQQQKLGISNSQALEDMVERCDTPSVRAFVRTITRSEAMGGSIGPILRELASDARRRRRQAAEEKMQKAPVKMLFPLMFLIFPALLLELMFPAAYSLMQSLGG